MDPQPTEPTRLLAEIQDEHRQVQPKLFALVYDELQRLAVDFLRDHPGAADSAQDLVRHAYRRLAGTPASGGRTVSGFCAAAAPFVRHSLVQRARIEPTLFSAVQAQFLAQLDQALARLERLDAGLSRLVELRHFGGLTASEAADLAGTDPREWELARAWLHAEIGD